jgi:hypothetical protein
MALIVTVCIARMYDVKEGKAPGGLAGCFFFFRRQKLDRMH